MLHRNDFVIKTNLMFRNNKLPSLCHPRHNNACSQCPCKGIFHLVHVIVGRHSLPVVYDRIDLCNVGLGLCYWFITTTTCLSTSYVQEKKNLQSSSPLLPFRWMVLTACLWWVSDMTRVTDVEIYFQFFVRWTLTLDRVLVALMFASVSFFSVSIFVGRL